MVEAILSFYAAMINVFGGGYPPKPCAKNVKILYQERRYSLELTPEERLFYTLTVKIMLSKLDYVNCFAGS
jgi:hypothetical protein